MKLGAFLLAIACGWPLLGAAQPLTGPADAGAPVGSDSELDLTSIVGVKQPLLLPAIVRVTESQGEFAGLDTRTFERFDFGSYKRFVTALSKRLEGKVVSAAEAQALITQQGLTVNLARTAAGLSKIARAANASAVVLMEFTRTGALVARIHTPEGEVQGEPVPVSKATLNQRTADDMAQALADALSALAKPAPPEPTPPVLAEKTPAEEEFVDSPFVETPLEPTGWAPDPNRARVVMAVGAGGVTRDLSVTGSGADQLAILRNGVSVGLGFYLRTHPLQFLSLTAPSRWAGLEVDGHFRRSFVKANGVEGSVTGTSCSMSDDELQFRATYRVRVAERTYAPAIGLAAGWTQERTLFEKCSLPLVSAAYSGVDAQLRIRQPLFKSFVALDVAAGPRFLVGAGATTTKVSFGGEAWVEAMPYSVVYLRGGVRGSRLSAALSEVALAETRLFFAFEMGVFF